VPFPATVVRPIVLALVAATAACGDDGSGPGEQLTGRYALVAVNGAPLPHATSTSLADVYEVTAATLAFSGNRVIEEQRYQRRTFSGTVSETAIDTVTYSYTLRDGVLVFIRPRTGGTARADTASTEGGLFVVRHQFVTSLGTPEDPPAEAAFAKVE
jgi:hypothetical protein